MQNARIVHDEIDLSMENIKSDEKWQPTREDYFKLEEKYRELENRYIRLYNKYCRKPLTMKIRQ